VLKFVSPSGWDFDRQSVVPMKVGSRGLIGEDRRDFLKTAAAEFGPKLADIRFESDESPVHLIALGATEYWGANRNGDGFKSAVCRRRHPTFVKDAVWYRNHKNKKEKGDPYFGRIKAAAYNEDMHRVELIVGLNAKESAARRNGGFVADQELEKLARGDDLPVSMAAYVPYDVCSFCGNKAKNRAEYCTREKCAAGGCRDNLARIVKVGGDVHHLHVDNPDDGRFVWFDISHVRGPADRTAYGASASHLLKAAADTAAEFDTRSYFEFADSQTPPSELLLTNSGITVQASPEKFAQIKLANALALLEKSSDFLEAETWRAVTTPAFPTEKLASYGSTKCSAQLAALADRAVFLSFSDFARLTAREHLVKTAQPMLPRAYTSLLADDSFVAAVGNGLPVAECLVPEATRSFAVSCHDSHSFRKDAADRRVFESCITGKSRPDFVKHARVADVSSLDLVRDYSLYKLAAMWRSICVGYEPMEVARCGLAQNWIKN
jgi:hypothetical protein